MKNKKIKIIVFIFLIVAGDYFFGTILKKMYFYNRNTPIDDVYYPLEKSTEEIIILGSSRAKHHFDPLIFEQVTGISCYNAGADGQSLFYVEAILKGIFKRYTPQFILIEISPNVLIDSESRKKLSALNPYYSSHPEIRDIINKRSRFENIKMLSHIYPFNSTLFTSILNIFKKSNKHPDGFSPLKKVSFKKIIVNETANSNSEIPQEKEEVLLRINKMCKEKGSKLIIVVSPYYALNETYKKINDKFITLLDKSGIEYFNYLTSDEFMYKKQLFSDFAHLDGLGASIFSKEIATQIKKTQPSFVSKIIKN